MSSPGYNRNPPPRLTTGSPPIPITTVTPASGGEAVSSRRLRWVFCARRPYKRKTAAGELRLFDVDHGGRGYVCHSVSKAVDDSNCHYFFERWASVL